MAMAAWQAKRVTIKLKTPLRCGDRPMGFVARTLPFVPSHVPLNAMTPVLVRRLGMPEVYGSYQKVLDFVLKHLRASPFFLLDPDDDRLLVPEKKGGTLSRIESLFLSSRHGIGMDYAPRGVRKGYLFEIEAIHPVTRSGEVTRLQGHIFWKPGQLGDIEITEEGRCNGLDLFEILKSSQWGGERNKGYGCLRTVIAENSNNLWDAVLHLEREMPQVVWPKETAGPFYLKRPTDSDLESCATGHLFPLVGRLYKRGEGFGQASSPAWICWNVGWISPKTLTLELSDRAAIPVSMEA